jgi:hypothetical protein
MADELRMALADKLHVLIRLENGLSRISDAGGESEIGANR